MYLDIFIDIHHIPFRILPIIGEFLCFEGSSAYSLSQWLTFKVLRIPYLVRKLQLKLLFHGSLAESACALSHYMCCLSILVERIKLIFVGTIGILYHLRVIAFAIWEGSLCLRWWGQCIHVSNVVEDSTIIACMMFPQDGWWPLPAFYMQLFDIVQIFSFNHTLPAPNRAPEIRWWEDEIPIRALFIEHVIFWGGISLQCLVSSVFVNICLKTHHFLLICSAHTHRLTLTHTHTHTQTHTDTKKWIHKFDRLFI